jgi:hypothetical protein
MAQDYVLLWVGQVLDSTGSRLNQVQFISLIFLKRKHRNILEVMGIQEA